MNRNRNLAKKLTYNYTSKRYKDIVKLEKKNEVSPIKITTKE